MTKAILNQTKLAIRRSKELLGKTILTKFYSPIIKIVINQNMIYILRSAFYIYYIYKYDLHIMFNVVFINS